MSSSRRAEGRAPGSLTRRMALIFAATTSLVLMLYALGAAYFVLDTTRDELQDFLAHESDELTIGLLHESADPAGVQRAVDRIASVTEGLSTAFRVRDTSGAVVAEAGRDQLLAAVSERIATDTSWRQWLWSRGVAVHASEIPGRGLVVELIADAGEAFERLADFGRSAAVALLLAVGLAALAGWFAAHRGLAGLRQVVDRARSVDLARRGAPLRVDGAPREVREVGEAFDAMLERIERGLSEMRTFTAGLAHELRSPLQNLIGETDVALLSPRSADDYRLLLKSNLDDLHQLSDAIDNLIAFCRSSQPRLDAARERFDLAAEAELRLQRERRSATRADVTLALSSSGDTRLDADREGCLRVLRNLVANALACSPSGSTVTVSIEGGADAVVLGVEDEGPGVPVELGSRIFEPFVSGPPRQGRRAGYGLGLAICRAVMNDHGGSLSFAARPAGGTRFVALFPRAPSDGSPVTSLERDASRPARHAVQPDRAPLSLSGASRT